MEYLGIDWSYRRAAWCSLSDAGVIVGEGAVPADADGLARLVIEGGSREFATSARVTCSTTLRRFFRTAIQTRSSSAAAPGYEASSGFAPLTVASGPSTARIWKPTR